MNAMWRAMLIGLVLLGCNFEPGQMSGDDDPIDARPDTPPDVSDGPPCFGDGAFRVCLTDVTPGPAVTLPATLNTTNDALCLATVPASFWAMSSAQPDSCVIVAESITVETTRVTGNRPLVLVAVTGLTINGILDLSSKRGSSDGPAANGACTPPSPLPGGTAGGGGGPGGSFQTRGGNGGAGDDPAAPPTSSPAIIAFPELLRGGCRGTRAGGTGAVEGGSAGGAAYLVAGGTMIMTGIVNASGAGAISGPALAGGSGGGSGGMVVMWAAELQTTGARIVANGGGGASGGDADDIGNPGFNPDPAVPDEQADGGSESGGVGGAGGAGYASTPLGGAGNGRTGDMSNEGGGGGGGGAGYIKSNLALVGATVAPPALVP